jgi:Immune inhibitor A-like, MAM domain
MLFLEARYGKRFVRDLLFTSGSSGISDGLAPTLANHRSTQSAAQTLQDWSTSLALDGVLDDGARLSGASPSRFQVARLNSRLNLDTPFAYAAPGAPPNGADFVRLRSAGGRYLGSDALKSLRFDGPTDYPAAPVEWTIDATGHAPGDPALYSGTGDGATDRAIVRSMNVDPSNPTLSFDARYDTEVDYDYGFVQVSTDGGATYQSRPATTTTTESAPDTDPGIAAQLPGFNGDSGGWVHESVDLSDLAGRDVLVAFRYMADAFVNQPGFWLDNVAIGGTPVSNGSTLDGWRTPTQIKPVPVAGMSLRLVAWDSAHRRAGVIDVRLNSSNDGTLTASELKALRDLNAGTVVAIVNHYEPTEHVSQPAPYALTVNGALQPGG